VIFSCEPEPIPCRSKSWMMDRSQFQLLCEGPNMDLIFLLSLLSIKSLFGPFWGPSFYNHLQQIRAGLEDKESPEPQAYWLGFSSKKYKIFPQKIFGCEKYFPSCKFSSACTIWIAFSFMEQCELLLLLLLVFFFFWTH